MSSEGVVKREREKKKKSFVRRRRWKRDREKIPETGSPENRDQVRPRMLM